MPVYCVISRKKYLQNDTKKNKIADREADDDLVIIFSGKINKNDVISLLSFENRSLMKDGEIIVPSTFLDVYTKGR